LDKAVARRVLRLKGCVAEDVGVGRVLLMNKLADFIEITLGVSSVTGNQLTTGSLYQLL